MPAATRRVSIVCSLIGLVALAASLPVAAQEKTFVLIPSIPGESTDGAHAAWIDAYGLDHTATKPAGGGPTFGQISVLKGTDKSTPLLHEALVLGSNLGLVKVEVCGTPPYGAPRCYYRVELTNARLNQVSLAESACASGSCTPAETETVTFSFTRITWVYKDASGTDVKRCWDLVAGATC